MKKKMNSIFFGSCFIAAVLLEVFCILILDGDGFSVAALGIVILITGYLLMDSLRSSVMKGSESARFYIDHVMGEQMETWNEKYKELMNLQKAIYTATKKNTAYLTEQLEALQTKLEALENSNDKAAKRITELQRKALEGQKNALNLEIAYMKENTKHLTGHIKKLRVSLKEQTQVLETENKKAPITEQPSMTEPVTEADNTGEVIDTRSTATPLYDDPNKSLTADEIASLFASFGQ